MILVDPANHMSDWDLTSQDPFLVIGTDKCSDRGQRDGGMRMILRSRFFEVRD